MRGREAGRRQLDEREVLAQRDRIGGRRDAGHGAAEEVAAEPAAATAAAGGADRRRTLGRTGPAARRRPRRSRTSAARPPRCSSESPWCSAGRRCCASDRRGRCRAAGRRPRRGRRAGRSRWRRPGRGRSTRRPTVKPHSTDLANESSTALRSSTFGLLERNDWLGCTSSTRGPTRWNLTIRPWPPWPRSSPRSLEPRPADSPVDISSSLSNAATSSSIVPARSSQ